MNIEQTVVKANLLEHFILLARLYPLLKEIFVVRVYPPAHREHSGRPETAAARIDVHRDERLRTGLRMTDHGPIRIRNDGPRPISNRFYRGGE